MAISIKSAVLAAVPVMAMTFGTIATTGIVSVATSTQAEAQWRGGRGYRGPQAYNRGYRPRGPAVAAGIVGGLALGALAAGAYGAYAQPVYPAPVYGAPVYGAPVYGQPCRIERQQVWNGYGYVWQRVRVCY